LFIFYDEPDGLRVQGPETQRDDACVALDFRQNNVVMSQRRRPPGQTLRNE
jgi:hypothetical protein